MRSSGCPKDDFAIVKCGHDDREVRQMGATSGGVIGEEDITLDKGVAVDSCLVLDGVRHCPQMDWDMGGICHEPTISGEDGARAVCKLDQWCVCGAY
jgi:hypothetical protein